MAIIRMMLNDSDKPGKNNLMAPPSDRKTIVFDEESPEMTDELLSKFKRVHPKTVSSSDSNSIGTSKQ